MKVLSPVVLQGYLAEPYFSEWVAFVQAVTLATNWEVNEGDVEVIRSGMIRFVRHYETHYYRKEYKRLAAMEPVFHALLHVVEGIEWLGPMWSYAQWVVLRRRF